MRTVKVSFTDAMFDALDQQANDQGQSGQHAAHAFVVRKAVRYWLNKNGASAASLDLTDAEYQEEQKIAGRPLPGTRKGVSE